MHVMDESALATLVHVWAHEEAPAVEYLPSGHLVHVAAVSVPFKHDVVPDTKYPALHVG